MGCLHEAVRQIDAMIERKGLDSFKTKGLISMKAGFFLALITSDTPDDLEKLEALKSVVDEVLGESLVV